MLKSPLILHIALSYLYFNPRHRFASAVALISTLGIMIGVCALIIVASVMQGLERRLQDALFANNYHVLAVISREQAEELLEGGVIVGYVPYIEGSAMLQAGKNLHLVEAYGIDNGAFVFRDEPSMRGVNTFDFIRSGTFALYVDSKIIAEDGLRPGGRVRLVSLENARYTPMGITPSQRNFTIASYAPAAGMGSDPQVIGHYDDIRRLMRTDRESYRLYLADPNELGPVESALQGSSYKTWHHSLGEFLRAVAMEKITMSLMLCLIIVVAAFNILSAVSMMVGARLHDIAILKTLGLGNGSILCLFLLMGLICSLIGSVLGTAIGIPMALNANEILSVLGISILGDGQSIPVDLNIPTIAWIFVFAAAVTCLCALYPALRASRAQIVDNLVRVS